MTPLQAPQAFGDFLLLQPLSLGAEVDVSVAIRLGDRSGRTFVLKRPRLGERPSGRAAAAVAREGEVLIEARGSGLVALEAVGTVAGLPYVAVEHVRGAALDVLMERAGGPLPAAAVIAIAKGLARALSALHEAGWAHGDVSPSNVLIDDAGELSLIDFGLAERIGTVRRDLSGKPGYLAPEAVRPIEASASQDVYGWGVVVAECLLGRRLFEERDLAEAASRGDAPASVAKLPVCAEAIVASLKRDPTGRPSAASIVERLASMRGDEALLAELVAAGARAPREAAPGDAPPEVPPRAAVAPTIADLGEPLEPTDPWVAEPVLHAPKSLSRPARRHAALQIGLALFGALVLGAIIGRISGGSGATSLAISGTLPRRTQVLLDGESVRAPTEGTLLPIRPGPHVLTIALPRGARVEYPFEAKRGSQVLLVPLIRGVGEPAEDRP